MLDTLRATKTAMRGFRRWIVPVVTTLLLVMSPPTRADERASVALEYARLEGAETCPDARSLRDTIASHLGYDPVSDRAETTVVVTLRGSDQTFLAEIQLRDSDGHVTGARKLSSTASSCDELAQSVALAVSIAIDPLRVSQPKEEEPEPEPEPLSPPPPAPVAVVREAPKSVPPASSTPLRPRFALGAIGSVGSAPAPAVGVFVAGQARWPVISLGLEGRGDFSAEKKTNDGRVSSSLLLATAFVCRHFGAFRACATASAGALEGSGAGVDEPRKDTTLFGAVGARAGVELRVSGWFAMEAFLDVRGTLTRTVLSIDGRDAWTTPPVSGALGLGAIFGDAP